MDEVSQGSPLTLFSSSAGRMFCRRPSPSQLGLVAPGDAEHVVSFVLLVGKGVLYL